MKNLISSVLLAIGMVALYGPPPAELRNDADQCCIIPGYWCVSILFCGGTSRRPQAEPIAPPDPVPCPEPPPDSCDPSRPNESCR